MVCKHVFLVQGSKSQLQADVRAIKKQDLDDFDFQGKAENPLQELTVLKEMGLNERRDLNVKLFYTFIGICNDQKISVCLHEDAKFFAGLLSKGDPDCVMTCTKEQMLKNLPKLPNGAKTVKFIEAIAVFLNGLDMNKKADKDKLSELTRTGCAAVGGSDCGEKSLSKRGFFIATVLYVVAQVGLLAAQSHIAATSDQEFTQ